MAGSGLLTFGASDPNAGYVLRPGGYLVIRGQAEQVAVAVTARGVYLPGGGQEAGESPEEAAIREAVEECGLKVSIIRRLGAADELVYDSEEGNHYRKRCELFLARVLGESSDERERDHRLVWLSRQEAKAILSYGSQRWALLLTDE